MNMGSMSLNMVKEKIMLMILSYMD
jgi:hypothetical protein